MLQLRMGEGSQEKERARPWSWKSSSGGRDKTQSRDFSRMVRKASIEEGLALLAVELLATSRQRNGVVSGKNGHVLDRRRPRNGVRFAETAVVIRNLNYVSF